MIATAVRSLSNPIQVLEQIPSAMQELLFQQETDDNSIVEESSAALFACTILTRINRRTVRNELIGLIVPSDTVISTEFICQQRPYRNSGT
ncbi:MAG: hypothetical protein ABL921_04155 [Pirellula sp.]